MPQSLSDLIEQIYPRLYHVTLGGLLPNIEDHGLSPEEAVQNWQDPNYYRASLGDSQHICVCTLSELPRTKYMISQGRGIPQRDPEMVIFEFPTSSVVRRNFDLDRSIGELASEIEAKVGDKQGLICDSFFLELLARYGCLLVFDPIPFSELIKVPVEFGGFLR